MCTSVASHSQSVDTMDERSVSRTIALTEVPSVMRAMGFYPSEQEVFWTSFAEHACSQVPDVYIFVLHAVRPSTKLSFIPARNEIFQIEDMLNEVKYSTYVETGKFTTDIELDQIIKCEKNFFLYWIPWHVIPS